MAEYALIKDFIVDNVIVADDEDWVTGYAADEQATAIHIDGLDPRPGIGWLYNPADSRFTPPVPPPSLTVQPPSIPPDQTTTALVAYTNLGNAPAQVTFVINGSVTQAVAVVDGVAHLPVAARVPNDTITVTCEGMSVVIEVTA